MKKLIGLMLLLALLLLTGCNCMSGFGRDLQNFGQWIERKSDTGRQ